MTPREHDVPLPTHTARVLEWGDPDAPLLVALHGFPDTAWTFRHLAPLLVADGWRVAAPFMRGYAPSGLTDDYWPVASRGPAFQRMLAVISPAQQ